MESQEQSKYFLFLISTQKKNEKLLPCIINFSLNQKNFIKLTGYISFAQTMWTTCD